MGYRRGKGSLKRCENGQREHSNSGDEEKGGEAERRGDDVAFDLVQYVSWRRRRKTEDRKDREQEEAPLGEKESEAKRPGVWRMSEGVEINTPPRKWRKEKRKKGEGRGDGGGKRGRLSLLQKGGSSDRK